LTLHGERRDRAQWRRALIETLQRLVSAPHQVASQLARVFDAEN
jgi:hypothetical protein